MNSGTLFKPGDIILVKVLFVDNIEKNKKRPALILYMDASNVVISPITSNMKRIKHGIKLSTSDGIMKDSIILLDRLSTISKKNIEKKLLSLNYEKKTGVFYCLMKYLCQF
ncbi:MAG: type II toxin-antitoxin system PemK/MazF family toxin [Promethearchaeota archaeon]